MAIIYDFSLHKEIADIARRQGTSYLELVKTCKREGLKLEGLIKASRKNRIYGIVSWCSIATAVTFLYFNTITDIINSKFNDPYLQQPYKEEPAIIYKGDRALPRTRREVLEEILPRG